jgi:hypothetical protein
MAAPTRSTSFVADLTPEGILRIPEDARKLMKQAGIKQVVIISDASGIRFIPFKKTLADIRSSAESDREFSEDFDVEIEEAMSRELRDKYR